MEHLGITLEMESQRVERTKNPRDSIVEVKNFDGRYMVSEVNEAIWSTRTFMQNGQEQGILILGVPSDDNITDSGPCILPDYKYISFINSGIHHGITLGIVKKIYKIN